MPARAKISPTIAFSPLSVMKRSAIALTVAVLSVEALTIASTV